MIPIPIPIPNPNPNPNTNLDPNCYDLMQAGLDKLHRDMASKQEDLAKAEEELWELVYALESIKGDVQHASRQNRQSLRQRVHAARGMMAAMDAARESEYKQVAALAEEAEAKLRQAKLEGMASANHREEGTRRMAEAIDARERASRGLKACAHAVDEVVAEVSITIERMHAADHSRWRIRRIRPSSA